MATNNIRMSFPSGNVKRVQLNAFLTATGDPQTAVNGTLRVTLDDDGVNHDYVNPSKSFLLELSRGAGISGLTITTTGSDLPTLNYFNVFDTVPPIPGGRRNKKVKRFGSRNPGDVLLEF